MATRKLWLRLSTVSVISDVSGITIGRMFRLCGATAVIDSTLVPGTIIGPPFDSEYAVEPESVLSTDIHDRHLNDRPKDAKKLGE